MVLRSLRSSTVDTHLLPLCCRSGSMMLRQLHFSELDLVLHSRYRQQPGHTVFESEVVKAVEQRTTILKPLPEDRFLCGFSHIFAGGYAGDRPSSETILWDQADMGVVIVVSRPGTDWYRNDVLRTLMRCRQSLKCTSHPPAWHFGSNELLNERTMTGGMVLRAC